MENVGKLRQAKLESSTPNIYSLLLHEVGGFTSSPFCTPHILDSVLASFGTFLGDTMHPSVMLTADCQL